MTLLQLQKLNRLIKQTTESFTELNDHLDIITPAATIFIPESKEMTVNLSKLVKAAEEFDGMILEHSGQKSLTAAIIPA